MQSFRLKKKKSRNAPVGRLATRQFVSNIFESADQIYTHKLQISSHLVNSNIDCNVTATNMSWAWKFFAYVLVCLGAPDKCKCGAPAQQCNATHASGLHIIQHVYRFYLLLFVFFLSNESVTQSALRSRSKT